VPRYFEYLVKAKQLGESTATRGLSVAGSAFLGRTFAEPQRPTLSDADEWAQLADRLWRGRASVDQLSLGVFPCPNADNDGAFVASLGLLLRETLPADTLLIDLDTSLPSLGRSLRTPNSPGWIELLASEPNARRDCVHESPWHGVFVMPAGAASAAYGEWEFARRLRWLHSLMARDFKAIVTRFPRASSTRRMRACYGIPDASVLITRPGGCRESEVRREANVLRSAGANLTGVILIRPKEQCQEA
jgi:Mrp family chromosome partitioning ATPase